MTDAKSTSSLAGGRRDERWLSSKLQPVSDQQAMRALTTVAKAIHQLMLCTVPITRMMMPSSLWTVGQGEQWVQV